MKPALLFIVFQLVLTGTARSQSPTTDSTSSTAFREALVSCYRSVSGTVPGHQGTGNGRVITSVETPGLETATFPMRLILIAQETSQGPRVITLSPSHVTQYQVATKNGADIHLSLRDYQSGRFTSCPRGDCTRRPFSMTIRSGDQNFVSWNPLNRTEIASASPVNAPEASSLLPQQELDTILENDLAAQFDGLCDKERKRAEVNSTPRERFIQGLNVIRSQITEGPHCQTVARRYPKVQESIRRFAVRASPSGGSCAPQAAQGRPASGRSQRGSAVAP